MPCNDGGYDVDHDDYTQKKLDRVTRLLCQVCRNNSEEWLKSESKELRSWWEVHQKEDAARLAAEAAEKKRKALRKRAISKLTQEERDSLGLGS